MELAKNLARLRRAAGMTQAQAAEYLSRQGLAVTHKAVSKWEQGASRPDGLQLLYLCRLYGVRDVLATFDGAGEKDQMCIRDSLHTGRVHRQMDLAVVRL